MVLNIISNLWERFFDWGVGHFFSIIISIFFILLSLTFTYVGYSISQAIKFSINKFDGYKVRKMKRHGLNLWEKRGRDTIKHFNSQ